MAAAKTMTTAQLAAELGTDARTLRKFLRSDASPIDSVGKGSRYTLPGTKAEITKLRKGFEGWRAAAEQAKAAKTDEAVDEDDEDEPDEDDTEPSDEELDEIDDEA